MTPEDRERRQRLGIDGMTSGALLVLETMIEGVRKEAARERRSPFEWKWYGWWLALLSSSDEQLVLVIAREAGCRLRRVEDVPALVPPEGAPMRIPSKACAAYLADLVQHLTTWTPSDRGVRRAMAILDQRVSTKARAA